MTDTFDIRALGATEPKIATGPAPHVLPPQDYAARADITLRGGGDTDEVANFLSAYDSIAGEFLRVAIGQATSAVDKKYGKPVREQAKADRDHIYRLAHTLLPAWPR